MGSRSARQDMLCIDEIQEIPDLLTLLKALMRKCRISMSL